MRIIQDRTRTDNYRLYCEMREFFSNDQKLEEELAYRRILDIISIVGFVNYIAALIISLITKMKFESMNQLLGMASLFIIGIVCVAYSWYMSAKSKKSHIMNKYGEYDLLVYWLLESLKDSLKW